MRKGERESLKIILQQLKGHGNCTGFLLQPLTWLENVLIYSNHDSHYNLKQYTFYHRHYKSTHTLMFSASFPRNEFKFEENCAYHANSIYLKAFNKNGDLLE